jgi:hypothetical protein
VLEAKAASSEENVEDDDEVIAPFSHALNEVGPPTHCDSRRRIHVGHIKFNDFMDAVGNAAQDRVLTIELEFHNDDAGMDPSVPFGKPKRRRRSTTGVDWPRTLTTPRIQVGAVGTLVI